MSRLPTLRPFVYESVRPTIATSEKKIPMAAATVPIVPSSTNQGNMRPMVRGTKERDHRM